MILNPSIPCLFKSHNSNYKDGEQKRDFIYIKDCIKVLLWFMDKKNVSGIYNLGTGQSRTFFDLNNEHETLCAVVDYNDINKKHHNLIYRYRV